MKKNKISYDPDHDILWIYNRQYKIAGSVPLGNLIFDHSVNGKVIGIEILDVTPFLKKFIDNTKKKITDVLLSLEEADFTFDRRGDEIIVTLSLKSKVGTLCPLITADAKEERLELAFA